MNRFSRLWEYLVDSIRSPRDRLTRTQHFVRQSWELAAHGWRQLQRHRAEGMAAELSYRTIFALVPVVVLGLVMFRIMGGLEEVQTAVENQLYSFFGVPDIPDDYGQPVELDSNDGGQPDGSNVDNGLAVETPASSTDSIVSSAAETSSGAISNDSVAGTTHPEDPDAQPAPENNGGQTASDADDPTSTQVAQAMHRDDQQGAGVGSGGSQEPVNGDVAERSRREARASIRRTLHEVTSQVASLDFRSIGVFGLLLFIYAAVALADSVEYLFNRIYEAPSQRPFHLRIAIHWSIITLGSGLLALSLYMSGQVVEWFGQIGAGANLRLFLSHLLSLGASWVLLFLLYALMPNTTVSVRAAAIGSFVSACLWEAAKFGFQLYVVTAVPYSAIYGSIGLIPLFLFWIYITWLIVLFGLILTYTLQALHGRAFHRSDWDEKPMPPGDPDWMLPIMCEVAHVFEMGKTASDQDLADRIGLPTHIVREMTQKLVEAGLLRRIHDGSDQQDALTLGRPAEKIRVTEILELAHRARPTNDHPAWRTLIRLKQAERAAADGLTLADIQLPPGQASSDALATN